MSERISEKIEEISKFLSELKEIVPENFEEYEKDNVARAACERYAEKIIEGVIDLGMAFLKEKKLKSPNSDLEIFEILNENDIISSELMKKLQDAKRMRNILAHEYGKVDDEIVFNAVEDELIEDINEFLEMVRKRLR